MSSHLESDTASLLSHSHKRPLERIETPYPRYVHATTIISSSPTLSSSSSYLSLASISSSSSSSSSPSSPELKRRCYISASNLLSNPRYNKGLAFSHTERTRLSLHGLLPAQIMTQEQQVAQTLYNCNQIQDGLEKYQYLMSLLARNEKLFFRTVVENVTQMLPILYTPTVGRACQEWGRIYQHPRGLHLSINDRSHIHSILSAYPYDDIRAIVFTDGERILGLGDLGAQGHGIPIGKLLLYTACAGVRPEYCLPITLDVGTNNTTLINDQNYPGLRSHRVRGIEYDTFIDEFISAVKERWGEYTLLQFEDFGNANAARLLDIYRDRCCTFNDDIQGTAAVGVAGIMAALRLTEYKHLSHHRVMFYGSGSAGIGIASLIAYAISCEEGITIDEARKNIYLVDSQGLVTTSRNNLAREKKPWAQDRAPIANDLATIVAEIRPTALIGVCAIPQTFTEKVIRLMASHTSRPIIFALSNPTSKAECTAPQAYEWTDGKALFASGSPFDPVTINGRTYVPGQGNNSYIFPGLSLAVISCGAKRVPDELFLVAASHLASLVSEEDLAAGTLYPPMANIREVSMEIAVAVAHEIYRLNLATITPKPRDMLKFMRDHVYDHFYAEFVTSQL